MKIDKWVILTGAGLSVVLFGTLMLLQKAQRGTFDRPLIAGMVIGVVLFPMTMQWCLRK